MLLELEVKGVMLQPSQSVCASCGVVVPPCSILVLSCGHGMCNGSYYFFKKGMRDRAEQRSRGT